MAALMEATAVVGESGSTERVAIGRVSADFFATLGVRPLMGRAFTEEEMTYQTDHEAILTDEYWRQRFDGDPNVLGRDVRSDGLPRRIVGVLPPGFRFLSSTARIYLPLSSEESERNLAARHSGNTMQLARLRPGATLREAQAQIDVHNAAHAAEFPYAKQVAESGFHTTVAPLHADHVASIRPILLLLQAGVLFLLLIGGVNLVNLLLIRATGHARELAIRQCIGATRRQVVSQVMAETVSLGLAGGLLGLVVGAGGVRLLAVLGADQLPLGAHIAFDGRLAVVALVASVVLGAVIAVPIAWISLRGHPANALKAESRAATPSRAAQRVRHAFIVVQIASAFVLLTGAGLLGLSLKRAMAISPGFRPDHILTGQFSLPWNSYQSAATFVTFADRLLEEAGHQPGVSAAGVITNVPLNGDKSSEVVTVVGYTPEPGASVVLHPTYGVAGDYFAAMGIPLREGRFIDGSDSHRPERTCVVDEIFARRYWPPGGALGQHLFTGTRLDNDEEPFTVVGVVGAVKQSDLTEHTANGVVYFPFSRYFARNYFLVARTGVAPEVLADTLRGIVRRVDPELPLNDLRSMEVRVADTLVARRSPALLAGLFAAVALLLAAIGTYGVLSYAVAQRRREIGVRMALGAEPKQIRHQFLLLGGQLLATGTMLGIVGAWLAGRAMQGILFDVPALHAPILGATAFVMSAVTLGACVLPSHRAARTSSFEALNED
jgi:predicted permease